MLPWNEFVDTFRGDKFFGCQWPVFNFFNSAFELRIKASVIRGPTGRKVVELV
jgi:hypothetical protein